MKTIDKDKSARPAAIASDGTSPDKTSLSFRRFDTREVLRRLYKTNEIIIGQALYSGVGPVFTLITKKKYYEKPDYMSLQCSFFALEREAIERRIDTLIMPHVGCGLDGLDWNKVRKLLWKSFVDSGIEIIVCAGAR